MYLSLKKDQGRLQRPIFLYDADCGVCTRTVHWLKDRGAGIAIEFTPYQMQLDLLRRVNLTEEECLDAAWVIEPNGSKVRLYRGAAAINYGFRKTTLPSSLGWRLLGRLYPLPGIRQAEDLGYAWFAKNRRRFSREGEVCSVEM
ncbi:DUF393 domain-containing protein [bacterium]|nr:DUF393 domain-containing protein [bacterium]